MQSGIAQNSATPGFIRVDALLPTTIAALHAIVPANCCARGVPWINVDVDGLSQNGGGIYDLATP